MSPNVHFRGAVACWNSDHDEHGTLHPEHHSSPPHAAKSGPGLLDLLSRDGFWGASRRAEEGAENLLAPKPQHLDVSPLTHMMDAMVFRTNHFRGRSRPWSGLVADAEIGTGNEGEITVSQSE